MATQPAILSYNGPFDPRPARRVKPAPPAQRPPFPAPQGLQGHKDYQLKGQLAQLDYLLLALLV